MHTFHNWRICLHATFTSLPSVGWPPLAVTKQHAHAAIRLYRLVPHISWQVHGHLQQTLPSGAHSHTQQTLPSTALSRPTHLTSLSHSLPTDRSECNTLQPGTGCWCVCDDSLCEALQSGLDDLACVAKLHVRWKVFVRAGFRLLEATVGCHVQVTRRGW